MKGRFIFAMAHGQPIQRVWQPWYIEEDRLKAMRRSPAKDLPTRTSKQKRLKDRRELDYVTLNARHRRCTETLLHNTKSDPQLENGVGKIDTDSVSDSGEEHENNNDEDEDDEDDEEEVVVETVDEDSPLDMTTPNRSRAASPPSSPKSIHVPTTRIYNPAPSYNSSHLQVHAQQRPSVITCAAALNHHPHAHHRHQGHQQHHHQHHGHMVSLLRGGAAPNSSAATKSDVRTGTRREVPSGMCDPVIDEHFRRSLGKDYPEFLSSTAPPVKTNPSTNTSISITGMSVDDHFAKALGDTWLRLQAGKPTDVALPAPPPSGTSKSISASSPTALGLQQRPGVVST